MKNKQLQILFDILEGNESSSSNWNRNTSSLRRDRRRSNSKDRKYGRGRDRGRDRSRDRHRSRSRNSRDGERSRNRDRSRDRHISSQSSNRSTLIKEEDMKHEPETYGYKSENYDKVSTSIKQEVKVEPRDIDMRKSRRESESYSPTRPDYKPTIKQQGNIILLKGGANCLGGGEFETKTYMYIGGTHHG